MPSARAHGSARGGGALWTGVIKADTPMVMTRKLLVIVALLGVVKGFYVGPGHPVVAKRPITLARHVASVSIAHEPSSVAPQRQTTNCSTTTTTKRRKGRASGKNRRRSTCTTARVMETIAASNQSSQVKSSPSKLFQKGAVSKKVNVSTPFAFRKFAVGALKPFRYLLNPWRSRVLLRRAWRRRAARLDVKENAAIDFSILECRNDFELVTRAAKELEHILETHFGAPAE